MSIQGNKLVEPIGLQEVYSLLGVAKTGTYYDVATICSSEKINPDARFKPERIDTPMEVNETQRKSNNFGWNVPSFQMGSLPGNASNEKGMFLITNVKHEEDPFGEMNTITLSITISNMSDKTLSGFDMALVNDYNSTFRPSVFGDTKMMYKTINPGERIAGEVSFAVDNIHRKFWLTFFDRRSGKAITKISVDNAYRKMSKKEQKKNERRRFKKNYKKDVDLFDID